MSFAWRDVVVSIFWSGLTSLTFQVAAPIAEVNKAFLSVAGWWPNPGIRRWLRRKGKSAAFWTSFVVP